MAVNPESVIALLRPPRPSPRPPAPQAGAGTLSCSALLGSVPLPHPAAPFTRDLHHLPPTQLAQEPHILESSPRILVPCPHYSC